MNRRLSYFIFCCAFVSAFFVSGFVSAAEPAATQLIFPEAGSTVSQTPTFYWTSVTGADRYELWVGGKSFNITSGYSSYKIQSSEKLSLGSAQWGVITCNSDGCSESEVWNITVGSVADAPPTVTVEPTPTQANIGKEITFTVTGRDDSGIIALYINFDDGGGFQAYSCPGQSSFCQKVWSHAYSAAGNYTVTAQVRDNSKQESSNQITVTVTGQTPAGQTPAGQTPSLGGSGKCPAGQICNPLKYGNFNDLVKAVINDFLIPVGSTVAGIMFVIAGLVYVTSVGDPGRVKTARDIMIYTAVGLAVILLASGLIKVLQSSLGGS